MQAFWVLASALLFSLMALFAKLASDVHSAWELLFWRNLVGLAMLVPIIVATRGSLRDGLRTKHLQEHSIRNLAGIGGIVLWFVALPHLPLATSTTLNNTSSLFIGSGALALALTRGRRDHTGPMVAWIAIGFIGVILVLHPTLDEDQLVWALAALGSGASAAVALVTVRKLGRLGEPPSRTVFYFALTGLLVGLTGSLVGGFTIPDARHGAILAGIGVTATLAQLAVTRAYGYGHTLLAANLSYAGILFASLWGWLVWSDAIDAISWVGIALIITAGASATWLTAKATPAK